MAPPSTPAPHRFLVPGTQRNDSPKPLPSGSKQFRATPRFSLHSTPREPVDTLSSSTPARPSTFVRLRQTESISDVIDSSPPDIQPSRTFSDSIEADSIPTSSVVTATNYESFEDIDRDGPTPKRRRRLSVFSENDVDSDLSLADELNVIEDTQSVDERSDDAHELGSDLSSDALDLQGRIAQQPTFHSAPRFVPVERPEASTRDPLPDAFSPRRRGTRDVPGGLAAEVRDWLMDIEANVGPKRDEDFIAKISVEEVRRGSGMFLIRGRNVTETSTYQTRAPSSVKVMLAGEGRLVGLARRNEVIVGSVVAIAKPFWEVDLGTEGRWAVACDWVLL
ncbi:hypothetical protein BKA67DRAFT_536508 [Truncatella angustata]|uniref:Uncharacterized protein n=1 Tax=Truncatella angustata TaxID=152316 RepID=A0A9P8ZX66_9PEZI|nr:uncharacterized protein BKA67DRAFT_536508 [Truncatella angustata]KAH6652788.1 hypothetical protein BKA67DRAFT_536508 [Truncatella angustata]KAH8204697.1 hypothetical protein TruAng_001172 [Truncatella angustata]